MTDPDAETRSTDGAGRPGSESASFPRAFGEYVIARELGRGAVGIVYEAHHRRLSRKVALKVLRSCFDDDAAAVERFRREATAIAQVRHDHVVDVYEAGEVDGRPFYAMELLDGRSLADLAKDKRLPPLRDLFAGIAEVADALAALHAAGIVHRDVKPSNIMARADGRMLLADFGLARTAESEALTRTGEALGTPYYMSPEQLLGKKGGVDGRADVYSLGATLYELVSGRPPCKGDDMASTVRKILTERPPALSTWVKDVPADAERVVMKAVEKRAEDRYASAAAMRDDLRAFAKGDAVVGRPVSATTRAARGVRRHTKALVAVGVAAAALVGWLATRPPEPARLEVTSHPAAEVFVDGASIGKSPVAREVPPGAHKITLKLAGYDDETSDITLEPGHVHSKEIDLVATDSNDPKTVEKLAADLGVSLEKSTPAAGAPSAARESFVPLFPRGKVRMEDLDALAFEVNSHLVGGSIEFVRNGEVVGESEFFPDASHADVPFPADVKKALSVGDVVKWGWKPKMGLARMTEFRVVATPPDRLRAGRFAEAAKRDPTMARAMAARALLHDGLCCGAYRQARAIVREKPLTGVAWQTMKDALALEDLDTTAAFKDAQAGYAAAQEAQAKRGQRPGK